MEAEFRQVHVGIKEGAEQIAFLRGERHALASLSTSLRRLASQQRSLAFQVVHSLTLSLALTHSLTLFLSLSLSFSLSLSLSLSRSLAQSLSCTLFLSPSSSLTVTLSFSLYYQKLNHVRRANFGCKSVCGLFCISLRVCHCAVLTAFQDCINLFYHSRTSFSICSSSALEV